MINNVSDDVSVHYLILLPQLTQLISKFSFVFVVWSWRATALSEYKCTRLSCFQCNCVWINPCPILHQIHTTVTHALKTTRTHTNMSASIMLWKKGKNQFKELHIRILHSPIYWTLDLYLISLLFFISFMVRLEVPPLPLLSSPLLSLLTSYSPIIQTLVWNLMLRILVW